MVGLDIPAVPILHQYWVTETVPELVRRHAEGLPEMPVLRDENINGYVREEGDFLMFGPYEPPEKLEHFALDGVPEWFGADLLPEDLAAVEENWETAVELVPRDRTGRHPAKRPRPHLHHPRQSAPWSAPPGACATSGWRRAPPAAS